MHYPSNKRPALVTQLPYLHHHHDYMYIDWSKPSFDKLKYHSDTAVICKVLYTHAESARDPPWIRDWGFTVTFSNNHVTVNHLIHRKRSYTENSVICNYCMLSIIECYHVINLSSPNHPIIQISVLSDSDHNSLGATGDATLEGSLERSRWFRTKYSILVSTIDMWVIRMNHIYMYMYRCLDKTDLTIQTRLSPSFSYHHYAYATICATN